MASNGRSDSNHLDQSSQSVNSATAAKSKGGRPPHPIRKEFHDVGSSDNSSKRGACDCKHCSTHFTAQRATVANLIKHIVNDCSNCPCDTRQTWQPAHAGAQATSTNGEAAVQAGLKRKRQTTLDSTMATQALQMTKMQRQAVDFHLLRWAICNNIPFQAFNDMHFFAAINSLRPHYQVPSPTTFKEKLLQQEYLGVMCKLQDRIVRAQNLTLSGDGWTNAAKHSVVAFTLQFPDRTSALLETRDVSADKHTAEMLADMFKDVIDRHNIRTKIALLVTDNAANMLKARRLVVDSPNYGHILEARCAMHAFNLVLGSLLAFPWAQELLLSAQRVVTYFRASHQPLALLRSAAERLDIKRGLHSANKTRFTSKHECVESVLRHQPAFGLLLNQHPAAISNPDVVTIIGDLGFWADLAKLNKLMLPLTKVIMAVQGNDSTLADVCRYWLYLVKELGAVLDDLPLDYQEHIIWAVSVRAKEQDTVLTRLALFLDPRFRQAASNSSSNGMHDFITRLSEYAASQGWDQGRINGVLGQLSQYGLGQPPFDQPCASGTTSSGFSASMWWLTLCTHAAAADLAELALVLLQVVPHAASPERVFSTMGWYEGGKATRLSVGTNAQKTAIKMHYDSFKPQAPSRPTPDAHVPDTIDLAGPAHISADAVSDPAAAAAAEEAAAAQRDSSGSQAVADESDEEEVALEEMQAALSKQHQADQLARQEAPVPDECRRDWRAAMRWALDVEKGADLLSPGYQEVLQTAQPRQISAPVPGIDPHAIARQFILQQQQAAAAAQAQAQALAVGVGGMPVLPYQAVVLQQVQALQQQQQQHMR